MRFPIHEKAIQCIVQWRNAFFGRMCAFDPEAEISFVCQPRVAELLGTERSCGRHESSDLFSDFARRQIAENTEGGSLSASYAEVAEVHSYLLSGEATSSSASAQPLEEAAASATAQSLAASGPGRRGIASAQAAAAHQKALPLQKQRRGDTT